LRDWTAILRAVGGAVERLGAPWNRPFGWGAGTPIWPVRLFAIPRSRDRPLTSTRSSVIDPSPIRGGSADGPSPSPGPRCRINGQPGRVDRERNGREPECGDPQRPLPSPNRRFGRRLIAEPSVAVGIRGPSETQGLSVRMHDASCSCAHPGPAARANSQRVG